jgi:hypothetical protein
MVLEDVAQRLDGDLAPQLPADNQAAQRCQVDDLAGLQHLGEFGGEQVGVDAQRMAVGGEADGREDRDDVGSDQVEDELLVDAVDPAGELLIQTLDDADGHRAHRVGDGALQPVLSEALKDEMRHTGRGADGEVERGGVGHARAAGVGDGNTAHRSQLLDLLADAVDQHQLDAEAAEDRDVDEQVAEVLVGDDRAVEGDDKDLPLEPRHIFEDAAEVRGFDRGDGGAVAHRGGAGVFVESGGRVNRGLWRLLLHFTVNSQLFEVRPPQRVTE